MNDKVIICFLGMDGSGKSTLSKYLYNELKNQNYDVSYTWWLEGENSLIRRVLRKFGKSKASNLENNDSLKTNKRNNTIFTKIFYILYPEIVLIDYLRFGIVKTWFPKITEKNKIQIFDRFFYDVILALSKEFELSESEKLRWLKIYNRLIPYPDLIFIIDITPEISYTRKKDEIKTIENANKIWQNYQEVFSIVYNLKNNKILKIDNTGNIEDTKKYILEKTLEIIKNDKNRK